MDHRRVGQHGSSQILVLLGYGTQDLDTWCHAHAGFLMLVGKNATTCSMALVSIGLRPRTNINWLTGNLQIYSFLSSTSIQIPDVQFFVLLGGNLIFSISEQVPRKVGVSPRPRSSTHALAYDAILLNPCATWAWCELKKD